MIKISTAVREILDGNSFLKTGMQQGLLNLSAVAEFIRPLVEARTKKSVQKSAVLMNLSRLRKQSAVWVAPQENFEISDLSVRANVTSISYLRTPEVTEKIKGIYEHAQKFDSYITMTQGSKEVTFLVEDELREFIEGRIEEEPRYVLGNLSALKISFDERFVVKPGLIYYLVQQLTMQNINICELASTYTQLVVYVKNTDLKLAFDTIYGQFMR